MWDSRLPSYLTTIITIVIRVDVLIRMQCSLVRVLSSAWLRGLVFHLLLEGLELRVPGFSA